MCTYDVQRAPTASSIRRSVHGYIGRKVLNRIVAASSSRIVHEDGTDQRPVRRQPGKLHSIFREPVHARRSEMTLYLIIAGVILLLYMVASYILLKKPELLHRKKTPKFNCIHISHRGGECCNRVGWSTANSCHQTLSTPPIGP